MPTLKTTILALACCLLCAFPALAATAIAGDVDGNGVVDATDVQLVINAALGKSIAANTDIDYDPDRATTALDVQLVINAASARSIDADGNGIADIAESNLHAQLQDALQKFMRPDIAPDEGADDLFAALQSLADALGPDQAQEALRLLQENFVNAGGALADLAGKSAQIPPLVFTPDAVDARRLERASAKADKDIPLYLRRPIQTLSKGVDKERAYRNTVIYVNGIWTNFSDFLGDAIAVRAAISGLYKPYAIKYFPIWNPSAGAFDLFPQSAVQKILEWVAQSAYVPDVNPTSIWIGDVITSEVDAGRNVVALPHSQGNFHVRQAIDDLPLATRASVNVIELASPVTTMPKGLRNLTRVDVKDDLVAELSGVVTDPIPYEGIWGLGDWIHALIPSPNFDPLGIILLDHHDLQGSYLKGKAKATILADIASFCITP
jgi:hypothetical protein